MNWYSNTGRARLVRELMAKGFSVRKAEKTVNAVFDRMIAALRRGERVELPVGWIQAKLREGKPRTQVKRLSNIHTRKTRLVIARYAGRRRVVTFKPDESLDLTPLPTPPPPLTAEQVECRRLAAELLGKPVDDQVMAVLQQAADFPRPRPGALLNRLRTIRGKGLNCGLPESLAQHIHSHHWL